MIEIKKSILIVVSIITVIVMIFCVAKGFASKEISITEESYYLDYSVENDKVKICCNITVNNPFDKDVTVKLKADLSDDMNIGLLKESELFGYSEDERSDLFVLPANSEKSFDVVFIGDFGGTDKKSNRNLPEITIIQL